MMQDTSKNTVVVTGFGPFGPHKVNDSWECVKRLKELNIEFELDITLITQEIPVIYAASDKEVLNLWKRYNPELVIHVGVHNTEDIKIEMCAERKGYTKLDVAGSCPANASCSLGNVDRISTHLDLKRIIDSVESKGLHLSLSTDAGKYLCEYTYFLSLSQDPGKSLFIHIPPAGTKPTIEDKTEVLKNIIIAVYKQLINKEKIVNV